MPGVVFPGNPVGQAAVFVGGGAFSQIGNGFPIFKVCRLRQSITAGGQWVTNLPDYLRAKA